MLWKLSHGNQLHKLVHCSLLGASKHDSFMLWSFHQPLHQINGYGSVLIIIKIMSCSTILLHNTHLSISHKCVSKPLWLDMPWNKVKICSTKQECCFCCTNLSHVITGVGFPVTLANKRNVPFSGTLSSSNRSRNRGGSSLSNGNSVIETSKLVTSVSVSGFKTNTFDRILKYFMAFISCLLQEERKQKCDIDLSDSSAVINSKTQLLESFSVFTS